MSLKEDIAVVKDEISTEEQFLTSSIKLERFVKRYKKVFFVFAGVCVAGIIGYVGYDLYEQDRVQKANEALVKLLKNANDKDSLEQLQSKSKKLYDSYVLSVAVAKNDKEALMKLADSKNHIISDFSKFQHASLSASENELRSYASSNEAIMRDFTNFLLAQKSIEKNDQKTARELLAKIPANSSIKEQALGLEHLLIKNKSN